MTPKVFYNSWIAKTFLFSNFSTIMLFGMIFTKDSKEEFTKKTLRHETIHVLQYYDCGILGAIISLMNIFIMWTSHTPSVVNIILTLLFPVFFYYIWYLVEWFIRLIFSPSTAYRGIAFEKQAYDLGSQWSWAPEEQTKYRFMSWVRYYFKTI